MIATDDHRICCIIRHTVAICIMNQLFSARCKTILDTLFSKTITTMTFSFVIFLNIFGILINYLKDRFITFQNILYMHISSLLYGLYLLSLFSVNHYFGHTYIFYYDKWIKHIFCKVISFLSLFSNLSYNKKVLLHERKRHTTCRIAITPSVVISWLTPPSRT